MNLFTLKRCPLCQAELFHGRPLCQTCFSHLRDLQVVERSERTDHVIFSLFHYAGDIQELIHRLKFRDERYLSSLLADFIVTFLQRNQLPVDRVSFVPMFWRKKLVRGYDQSQDIAQAVARRLGVPCLKILKRNRPTKSLYRLGRLDRRRALEGAMTALASFQDGYTMIIDDILTTGSTIDACAKALRETNNENYFFLVIAKAIQSG